MKRKIIKQGHNTLTITLPTEWVQKLNLKAGDELDVIQNNGSLTINGKQNNGIKSATIDIRDLRVPMVWRFFSGVYREGYNEIKIVYDEDKRNYEGAYNYYSSQFSYTRMGEKPVKKPFLEMIQEMVDRYIGIVIIDHGKNYCTIREMGELSSKEFDNSLRRIFLLLIELFEKVIELIKEIKVGDITICKTLHTMDINVDRFIDYCCRINNRINDSSFQKNKPIMFSTLFLLELLGDEFKYIGTHLASAKKSVDEILPFAKRVKEHFEMYYHLFYKFERDKVVEFGENDFKIYNEHFEMHESKNKEVNSIRRHLMQISKLTLALMELRIEMEF